MKKLLLIIGLLISSSLFAGELKLTCEYQKELNNPAVPLESTAVMLIKDYEVSEEYRHNISLDMGEEKSKGQCKIIAGDSYELAFECKMDDESELKVNYIATQNQLAIDMIVAPFFYDCEYEVI